MSKVQLLVLNGASSTGKTALCKALQEVLDAPFIHLEEDCFVFNTFHSRFLQGEIASEIFSKTMLGYYRSLKAFLSAGHNVLADTGFYTPTLLAEFVHELYPKPVWMVGVHCELDELERREQARGDRQRGLAREQYMMIHRGLEYDIEVDTTRTDVKTCALAIKAIVEGTTEPKALAHLWALLQIPI